MSATYRITDAELDEVSAVSAGDDPSAKILIVKRAPETTHKTTTKEVKRMNAVSAVTSRARQLEAEGLEPAAAFAQAMDEKPDLIKAYREQRDEEPVEEMEPPLEKAARIERERRARLERNPALKRFYGEVEQIKKDHNLTDAEAFRRAGETRPELYAAARRATS